MYEVGAHDTFQIQFYPEVRNEIVAISKHLQQMTGDNKARIVISFLKDHCIRTAWFSGNEDVVKLVTSRFLDTAHIEALFQACRQNGGFMKDFEQCISISLT